VPFKDIEQIIEPLTLPIRGKDYVIPPIGVLSIARYEEVLADDEKTMTNAEFYEITLGPAYEQMRADNVAPLYIQRAAYTSLADTQRGRAIAEVMWETGGNPKAQDPQPAETTPPAAANTTKRRASGSGTKTSRRS
jgi:hypothetical protein